MWSIRQPRAWLVLLFILAEAGFVAAASWQWQRGAFKDRCAFERGNVVPRAVRTRRRERGFDVFGRCVDDMSNDVFDIGRRTHGPGGAVGGLPVREQRLR